MSLTIKPLNMKSVKFLIAMAIVFALYSFNTIENDTTLSLDTSKSNATWTGYHLAKSYEHTGNINFKSGSIELTDGELAGGAFVIDMNSISNEDLSGSKNAKLVNHLKSEDFFYVEKYDEAILKLTEVNSKGDNTYDVTADLTIRGITESIDFTIEVNNDQADVFQANANLKIDRSIYKVMYGWSVENAVISNEFDLEVNITASE